jgi:hypothetical protein
VNFDKDGDKRRRNAFQIDAEFIHGDVVRQAALVDASEVTQEVTQDRTYALGGVGVNFSS